MKHLSEVELLFSPTKPKHAVNKEYVDNLINEGNGNSSIYVGEIELKELVDEETQETTTIVNITLDKDDIEADSLLCLKSATASNLDEIISNYVQINNEDTEYYIQDKFTNNAKFLDVITGGWILLMFTGTNFILLTKDYLINSYQSSSISNAPTAKALKDAYDKLYDIVGDIPEVLDTINRKVV